MNSSTEKANKLIAITDFALLLLCGIIVSSRLYLNETITTDWFKQVFKDRTDIGFGQDPSILLFSGLILTMFAIWFTIHIFNKQFQWRKTFLVIPLILLTCGGMISTVVASNKYSAAIGSLTLIAAVVFCILLIQLLDQRWKWLFILSVIIANGSALSILCWQQRFEINPDMAAEIEKNADQLLAKEGLTKGTYEAFQYLSRAKSQDVKGYFRLSNSAASYFLLSMSAALALIIHRFRTIDKEQRPMILAILSILFLVQLLGLGLTKSKGGIASCCLIGLMLIICYQCYPWLNQHRQKSFYLGLSLLILGIAALVGHGLYHGSLPGNSLWIRWQYWQATAAMILDHFCTGVGGHNFGTFYPRYMDPGAPEIIIDPHSFPLSLWSQYGLLAFAAFIWAFVSICRHMILSKNESASTALPQENTPKNNLWMIATTMIASIILVRYFVSSDYHYFSQEAGYGLFIYIFIFPALYWLVAFLLTQSGQMLSKQIQSIPWEILVLSIGLLGFIIHNCIDIAIFEPGIHIAFFALLACAIAMKSEGVNTNQHALKNIKRLSMISMVVIAGIVLVWIKVIMPKVSSFYQLAYSQKTTIQAFEQLKNNQIEMAHNLFDQSIFLSANASLIDPHNPYPLKFQSQLIQFMLKTNMSKFDTTFEQIADITLRAAQRDPQKASYDHQLSQIYTQARSLKTSPVTIETAYEFSKTAYEKDPVNPMIAFDFALKNIEQKKVEQAITILEKILDDHNRFIEQQKRLLPNQPEYVSRLSSSLKTQCEMVLEKISSINIGQNNE